MAKLWQITRVPLKISINKLFDVFKKQKVFKSEFESFEKFIGSSKKEVPFTYLKDGYFFLGEVDWLIEKEELIKYLGEQILRHNFNLLGTGWINRNHTIATNEIVEFLPQFWKDKAQNYMNFLSARNYQLINFWNDPKSGFIWLPKYYKGITISLGYDVKQPWELGRMQHLPVLAYCYFLARKNGDANADVLLEEFENEILDFVATNPVGYSVQWLSPMDVGIRLANWLFAYDLFASLGATFSKQFWDTFLQSIYEHIVFLFNNLEWSSGLRGNHYFANITSLLLAGAYLPESDLATSILTFAINELISETLFQFYEDGGNFEASTYYHIQVVEMLLLSLFIVQSIGKEQLLLIHNFLQNKNKQIFNKKYTKKIYFSIDMQKGRIVFPKEFLERVYKIVKFTHAIRKSNDEFVQIGDNDSGFFLRPMYFFENFKIGEEIFDNVLKRSFLDFLLQTLNEDSSETTKFIFKSNKSFGFNLPKQEVIIYPKMIAFDKFGLFVFKSAEFELFLRCGGIGQQGKGGHSHNDQLSFCFSAKGKDFVVDPGLFCYSCSEEERNRSRSVHNHNTLALENEEQNLWKTGDVENLFWIFKHRTKSKVISYGDNFIVMEHYAYKKPHRRLVKMEPECIVFEDTLELDKTKMLYFHLHPNVEPRVFENKCTLTNIDVVVELNFPSGQIEVQDYDYCPQYGLKIKAKKIVVKTLQRTIIWSLCLK